MGKDVELLSINEVAVKLCQMAQATAQFSQNWTNYQAILESALKQTFEAGKRAGVSDGNKVPALQDPG